MSPPIPTSTFALPSGRELAYAILNPTASSTILYFHSFPSSHHEAALFLPAATAHSVRIIAVSRPGMGGSTPDPTRRLADWPADVLALADHLHLPRFAILGVSGGGPHALACLRAIPRERVAGVAVVSGLYPAKLGLAGMLPAARALLWIAPWVPGLVAAGLEMGLGRAARDDARPERFEEALMAGFKDRPEEDRRALEDKGVRDAIVAGTREAVRAGGRGPAHEAALFGGDWGFELAEMEVAECSLVLWHGGKDVNVPLAMAERAAGLLEGSDLRVFETEAHVSLIVNTADEVMGWLAGRLKE